MPIVSHRRRMVRVDGAPVTAARDLTAREPSAGAPVKPLTVDSGDDTDVWPGRLVTWLHSPRGGYGYLVPVDATVLSYARRPRTWVRVEVETRDGRRVARRVDVSNLRPRAGHLRVGDLRDSRAVRP